jgi:hypothetical protein
VTLAAYHTASCVMRLTCTYMAAIVTPAPTTACPQRAAALHYAVCMRPAALPPTYTLP